MKLKTDPRHIQRTKLMKNLFTWDFNPKKNPPKVIFDIVKNIKKIDTVISDAAKDRPIREINKIDLAILRLAVFELIIKRVAPLKVIVDEAVELAKEFGSDSSSAFINGALGQIIKTKGVKI